MTPFVSIEIFSMTPNVVIEIKTLEMTNDSILIKYSGLFLIHSLKIIYKSPNKILIKISFVPVMLTLLSLRKKCSPQKTVKKLLMLLLHIMPPPPNMGNDPSWFIIGGMEKGEATVRVIIILSTGFLLPLLYSHNRILWFLPFFSVFSRFFLQL